LAHVARLACDDLNSTGEKAGNNRGESSPIILLYDCTVVQADAQLSVTEVSAGMEYDSIGQRAFRCCISGHVDGQGLSSL
jgi:hypothetical protein